MRTLELLEPAALARALEIGELRAPVVALTLHPASLEPQTARDEALAVAGAVRDVLGDDGTIVVTLPNDDPGSAEVRDVLLEFAGEGGNVHAFAALGQLRYLSLLRAADAVVGNSSSAIIEAPSFRVPVVNVGDRQHGRTMARNIATVAAERDAIAGALRRALRPEARRQLRGMQSPYGDGRVSERLLAVLAALPPGPVLRRKRFVDLPDGPWRGRSST
jgi:UDP-N-acetylglucosamine 2-epimerase